jgi:hypothetical protein
MSRRIVYIAVGGLLICLLVLWFTRNYAIVSEEEWTGMRPEAASNPLLAARMLLERMGSNVEQSQDLERLSRFATSGTLFLADRGDVTPPLAHALRDWVRRGGHLIIAAERHLTRDPLLQELGVFVQVRRQDTAPAHAEPIVLPDGGRLEVALPPGPGLSVERDRLDWWYESNGTLLMVQLTEGRGRVTVMSSFAPFHNRAIGRYQHADLLWYLAGGRAASPIWLVRRLQTQSLPGWLLEHALPALIALALVLLGMLWRVMPRFGPLVQPGTPDRRSLTEHLTAMGRFYSSQGQLGVLIGVLRQDALDALAHKVPETRMADGAARLKAAARVSGMRPRALLYAFTSPASSAREFAGAVRLLREFRTQLAHSMNEGSGAARRGRTRASWRRGAGTGTASSTLEHHRQGMDA